MAQIAIPVLLAGVVYLMSNDKDDEKKNEGFSDINELKNQGNLLANENETFYPEQAKSSHNMNNQITLSQYQDKYFTNTDQNMRESGGVEEFQSLTGSRVKTDDMNHNNMNVFYSGKSNGDNNLDHQSILDSYTGQGTYDIKKEEIAPLFKPENNTQNVFGNQNENDFMQQRVQASQRHANTKPWEEIKVTPGIGMGYDEKSDLGMNNYAAQRDMYKPKTVDELRTSNNPKQVFTLHNHVGPAIQPVTNRGIQGKVVKKRPDVTFRNNENLGVVPHAHGNQHPMQKSHQMLTDENRPHTSVEYYGARGSSQEQVSYVQGTYMDSEKQQLEAPGAVNMTQSGVNPTSSLNYSKDSYNTVSNNRSTTDGSYFGNIGGMISNIIEPIANGLRHSKKTNITTNVNPSGFLNGGYKQPVVYNPNERVDTTNREMYEGKLAMKHLNVQKQDATAYMNTRPLLNDTQRISMNQDQTGPAQSRHEGNKSYQAEYNQRNQTKVHASDVKGNGNMALFNNKVKMIDTNKEVHNDRQTPFYNPKVNQYEHPTDVLGSFTNMPQTFENKSKDMMDSSLLQAFKQNPYTQSLHSAL